MLCAFEQDMLHEMTQATCVVILKPGATSNKGPDRCGRVPFVNVENDADAVAECNDFRFVLSAIDHHGGGHRGTLGKPCRHPRQSDPCESERSCHRPSEAES